MLYLHYDLPKTNVTDELEYRESDILLKRRKELKMTQQQVADKAGIQLRQYQRLENGERNISSSSGKIMLSVCETLKLDPYIFLGKGNEDIEDKYVVLPPIETQGLSYAIPRMAYYIIVSAIPRGMVCTEDEILSSLRKAYGSDSLEINSDVNSGKVYAECGFPFWRLVSHNGYLINGFYCSKEKQMNFLNAEGVSVNKIGENESYRVDDFEFRRFPICKIKIMVMKTMEQMLEEFQKSRSEQGAYQI